MRRTGETLWRGFWGFLGRTAAVAGGLMGFWAVCGALEWLAQRAWGMAAGLAGLGWFYWRLYTYTKK